MAISHEKQLLQKTINSKVFKSIVVCQVFEIKY
jgi:hypothetical protein